MAGVSVKDVDAQKFITAYAAFLKRSGMSILFKKISFVGGYNTIFDIPIWLFSMIERVVDYTPES